MTVSRALLLLPPVLFAAHVAEEAPGYVRWFNTIAGPPLPESGFVQAQLPPFLAVLFLAGAAAAIRGRWAPLILLIWCSHFFFANAIYHLVASVALLTFSPGLLTGSILYIFLTSSGCGGMSGRSAWRLGRWFSWCSSPACRRFSRLFWSSFITGDSTKSMQVLHSSRDGRGMPRAV